MIHCLGTYLQVPYLWYLFTYLSTSATSKARGERDLSRLMLPAASGQQAGQGL